MPKYHIIIALFVFFNNAYAQSFEQNSRECIETTKVLQDYIQMRNNLARDNPPSSPSIGATSYIMGFNTKPPLPMILTYQKMCDKIAPQYLRAWANYFAINISDIQKMFDSSEVNFLMSKERSEKLKELAILSETYKKSHTEKDKLALLNAVINYEQIEAMQARVVGNMMMDLHIALDFSMRIMDILQDVKFPNGKDEFVSSSEWLFYGFDDQEKASKMYEFLSTLVQNFSGKGSIAEEHLNGILSSIDHQTFLDLASVLK